MRICMPARALPVHRWGGLEFHTFDLARALAERGHDVTILTSAHSAKTGWDQMAEGLRVWHLPKGAPGDYSFAFFQQLKSLLLRLDASQPFDIIHAQEFAGLFAGPFPGRFVCTIHGTMFSETPLDRRFWPHLICRQKLAALWRHKPRIALHPFFKRMLKRADRLIVDSDFTWREICGIIPRARSKMRLIPLGADFTRYAPANRSAPSPETAHAFTVALLGRIQEMKGLGMAMRAAALLRERGIDFRMIIAGAGDYSESLRRAITENGLQKHVDLRGPVAPESLGSFFLESDVFLFPDLTQPAFGLVAIEAMHHGLPVIGARSGAIPEIVTDETGWIYDPWNPAELASLIGRLARNPAEVEKKAWPLSSAIACYNAPRMAADAEKVYLELAATA